MSMSTGVVGIIPADKDWEKKRKAWEACEAAGVKPPKELWDFFGEQSPTVDGREVELPADCIRDYDEEDGAGIEVVVEKIPKEVKIIRFTNSW